MGAKLKSKTHLQNTFFDFLNRFLRVWLQSLKKVLIWPNNFFMKKSKKVSKNAEFHADFVTIFFWRIFSKLFQRIRNQHEILRFLAPFFIKKKKKILGHFSNFDWKCAENGSKKRKIFFYACILEFNYATIKGFA